MMFDVRLDSFRIGLTEPIETARGTIFEREGWIVVVHDDAGHWGRGEVAPLPGWSSISVEEAQVQIEIAVGRIRRDGFSAAAAGLAPEIRAAVDTARLSLDAARAELPLWRHLGGLDDEVAVNALVVGARPEDLAASARVAIDGGTTTIKTKLGMGDDADRLEAIGGALRDDVLVRLDANAAWGAAEAVDRIGAAHRMLGDRLEYVEDPVADLADLAEVRSSVPAPLAVDELVRRPTDVDAIARDDLADVVVVKPALVGGITDTLELASRTSAGGLDVVLSSLYDGPVGLAAWCHLAAALGGDRAHGLGTATLLADAGAGHLVPRRGRIRLR
ncbi:MAG: o-succinylbenzoate synthase [Actinomycetota bacterium]